MPTDTPVKIAFNALVEDVMILILAYCDMADVVAFSGTSKYFHRVAFTGSIWRSLVSQLCQRGYIDLRPNAEDLTKLSTEQLVDLVKRVAHGPKAWGSVQSKPSNSRTIRRAKNLFRKMARQLPVPKAPSQPSEPPVSWRSVLHPEIAPGLHWDNFAKLLPGGKYVLFKNQSCLECWSVAEDKPIWIQSPPASTRYALPIVEFDASFLEDGRLVIVICTLEKLDTLPNSIQVFTLDPKNGISNLELFEFLPDSLTECCCTVCGDIVAVHFDSASPRSVLIINWRKASRTIITNESLMTLVLIPDYLVLSLHDRPGQHRLAAIPLCTLEFVRWRLNDSDTLDSPMKVAAFHIGAHNSIVVKGYRSAFGSLWAYECPLRRGHFKVWFHTWLQDRQNDYSICSYELFIEKSSPHQTGLVSWRPLSSHRLPDVVYGSGMSLWGHTLGSRAHGYRAGPELFSAVPMDKQSRCHQILTVNYPNLVREVHLSPFSGAITYSTHAELVILHYE
ncbi:hypothetical protein R3P38DRAFT_2834249 [Favolaschia claudopus]|uniref:F-box domain-containing protein n=1 Tax=Favolaschia claudopus TaxID=2862362 RepID=A0AAW0EEH3_9AGAR